jgi:peroxiredoxin
MAQLEPMKLEIEKAGAQLTYIAAEKRGGLFKPEEYLKKHPISFPFLLDEDRVVTKAYGLHHRLGTDAINIAHPATLLIDSGGTVRFIYRGDDQTDRAPVEQVLEAARKLQTSGGALSK